MTSHCNKLIDNISIIIHTVVTVSILRIKWLPHIKPIQPHLILINLLVPETAIGITRMRIQLTAQQIQCFLVFLVLSLLVNTEKHLSGIQTVNIIFLQFISFDRAILMNHCISISHSIIKKLLITVCIIYIQHSLKFQAMTVIPLQTGLKIQLPGFGTTHHL